MQPMKCDESHVLANTLPAPVIPALCCTACVNGYASEQIEAEEGRNDELDESPVCVGKPCIGGCSYKPDEHRCASELGLASSGPWTNEAIPDSAQTVTRFGSRAHSLLPGALAFGGRRHPAPGLRTPGRIAILPRGINQPEDIVQPRPLVAPSHDRHARVNGFPIRRSPPAVPAAGRRTGQVSCEQAPDRPTSEDADSLHPLTSRGSSTSSG